MMLVRRRSCLLVVLAMAACSSADKPAGTPAARIVGVGSGAGSGVDRGVDDMTGFERGVGDARQDALEVGSRLLFLKQTPQRSMSCGHKQQNGNNSTHRRLNHTGPAEGKRTRPQGSTDTAVSSG